MKVTLLTGFLGAGKTTTLARILRDHHTTEKFGVIVNDLSDLEVDGELIRNGDLVSEKNGTLASITGGALSDHNRDAFHDALRRMQADGLRHILIEASGSADPTAIIEELASFGQVELGAVIALVDARSLLHDYSGGRDLAMSANSEGSDVPTASHLLVRQLTTASVIALSKSDLVSESALENILRSLARLNPSATLAACTYGKLDPRLFLDVAPYDSAHNQAYRSGGASLTAAACDIGNTIIRDSRPFHPKRFHDLYREHLGLGIFRSKGFLWFASRSNQVLLWNQAGGAMGLEFLGTWRAGVLADPRLLPEEREELTKQLAGAHPVFGDRGCELTIIGTARDRDIFCKALCGCFCTDAEVLWWKQGKSFADPWPKGIKQMP
jgi:G3E family GTPase